MSDLVALARRYVALGDEPESVRGEIKRAVLNGAGESSTRPTRPARSSGGSQHPNAAKAASARGPTLEG